MNNQTDNGGRGCFQFLELLVVVAGATILYPNTAELFSYFAPNQLLGYTDIKEWWGMYAALIVGGLLVLMKVKSWIYPSTNITEWAFDNFMMFVLMAIDGVAQILHGYMIHDLLAEQPVEIQRLYNVGVPLVPLVIIGMVIVRAQIDSAPGDLFGGFKSITVPRAWHWLNPVHWIRNYQASHAPELKSKGNNNNGHKPEQVKPVPQQPA